eukprot:TRINITY_DN5310_c0_g1_i1.p1 TRINITY_DN5310_c0_g1~~TRINITY_DN5310_c0_g1_i1.p1  ORF type:complete len:954 (+),score=240.12 TRINITY_DN5310_c0_g1_i1:96-2957(+)
MFVAAPCELPKCGGSSEDSFVGCSAVPAAGGATVMMQQSVPWGSPGMVVAWETCNGAWVQLPQQNGLVPPQSMAGNLQELPNQQVLQPMQMQAAQAAYQAQPMPQMQTQGYPQAQQMQQMQAQWIPQGMQQMQSQALAQPHALPYPAAQQLPQMQAPPAAMPFACCHAEAASSSVLPCRDWEGQQDASGQQRMGESKVFIHDSDGALRPVLQSSLPSEKGGNAAPSSRSLGDALPAPSGDTSEASAKGRWADMADDEEEPHEGTGCKIFMHSADGALTHVAQCSSGNAGLLEVNVIDRDASAKKASLLGEEGKDMFQELGNWNQEDLKFEDEEDDWAADQSWGMRFWQMISKRRRVPPLSQRSRQERMQDLKNMQLEQEELKRRRRMQELQRANCEQALPEGDAVRGDWHQQPSNLQHQRIQDTQSSQQKPPLRVLQRGKDELQQYSQLKEQLKEGSLLAELHEVRGHQSHKNPAVTRGASASSRSSASTTASNGHLSSDSSGLGSGAACRVSASLLQDPAILAVGDPSTLQRQVPSRIESPTPVRDRLDEAVVGCEAAASSSSGAPGSPARAPVTEALLREVYGEGAPQAASSSAAGVSADSAESRPGETVAAAVPSTTSGEAPSAPSRRKKASAAGGRQAKQQAQLKAAPQPPQPPQPPARKPEKPARYRKQQAAAGDSILQRLVALPGQASKQAVQFLSGTWRRVTGAAEAVVSLLRFAAKATPGGAPALVVAAFLALVSAYLAALPGGDEGIYRPWGRHGEYVYRDYRDVARSYQAGYPSSSYASYANSYSGYGNSYAGYADSHTGAQATFLDEREFVRMLRKLGAEGRRESGSTAPKKGQKKKKSKAAKRSKASENTESIEVARQYFDFLRQHRIGAEGLRPGRYGSRWKSQELKSELPTRAEMAEILVRMGLPAELQDEMEPEELLEGLADMVQMQYEYYAGSVGSL